MIGHSTIAEAELLPQEGTKPGVEVIVPSRMKCIEIFLHLFMSKLVQWLPVRTPVLRFYDEASVIKNLNSGQDSLFFKD